MYILDCCNLNQRTFRILYIELQLAGSRSTKMNMSSYARMPWISLESIWKYHRRKFRSQTSDNMDRWKAEMGRVREKRRVEERRAEERRSEKRKSQKKEDAGVRKGRKVAKHCVFPMICGLRRSRKVGSLKRRVRSHLARWEMNNCTPLWREAHFQVKFTKHHMLGPLLEIAMSKKCTPLWREAHFEVKMHKTHHVRTTFGKVAMSKKCTPLWREAHFEVKMHKTIKTKQVRTTFGRWDVEKVHAVVARSTVRSQNVKSTRGSDHVWTLRCRFAWQAQGIVHLVKSE